MIRPRRSVLYMPGANTRALEKARQLPADVLVLDLEDAVAPAQKIAARAHIVAALAQGDYGNRELVVRVNPVDSEWFMGDIQALVDSPVHSICLPKVEHAPQVVAVAEQLDALGMKNCGLWAMAETPTGVFNIREIARAHPRLEVIMMGTSDLAKELRARHVPSREPFLFALSQCVMAAREASLDIIDGVHLALDDDAGLVSACEHGRDLGFDGKSLIHPRQLEAANKAFQPSAPELEEARAMIAAWQQAQAEGLAVVVVNGKLVENLHVAQAQRTLALHDAIEAAC